ncbi:MAG: polysaccharide deacetylase family protein, partial [Sphingomonadaceae bacterium]
RYNREGGPDFTRFGLDPFWAGPRKRLLALPLSTAYTGRLRAGGRQLYRWAGEVRRTRALLARTGLFARIPLTPEGVPAEDAREAIRVLAGEGLGFFSLSFHSPSLEPGHTAYVRDAADLKVFYAWWDAVIAQFHQLGIRPMGAEQFVEMMWRARGAGA